MDANKVQRLKNDIDGYIGNVLYKENKLSKEELKDELRCVCEYMMALCDLLCDKKIESKFLGIAPYINENKLI